MALLLCQPSLILAILLHTINSKNIQKMQDICFFGGGRGRLVETKRERTWSERGPTTWPEHLVSTGREGRRYQYRFHSQMTPDRQGSVESFFS